MHALVLLLWAALALVASSSHTTIYIQVAFNPVVYIINFRRIDGDVLSHKSKIASSLAGEHGVQLHAGNNIVNTLSSLSLRKSHFYGRIFGEKPNCI